MPWPANGPRGERVANCAACSTNTKGTADERDDRPYAMAFSAYPSRAWMGLAALHVAGRGTGGARNWRNGHLPQRLRAVLRRRDRAGVNAGRARHHILCGDIIAKSAIAIGRLLWIGSFESASACRS